MIFYTIYTSTPTGETSKEVVENITEESIRWNSKHGITGILLCLEDRFFQFLEGNEEDVVEVFEMIKGDRRHKDVVQKIKGYAKERVFSEWSMGSWMLSNEDLSNLQAVNDLTSYLDDPVNANLPSKRFVETMRSILEIWLAHEPERSKRLQQKGES